MKAVPGTVYQQGSCESREFAIARKFPLIRLLACLSLRMATALRKRVSTAGCQIEDPPGSRFGARGSSVNVLEYRDDTSVGGVLSLALNGTCVSSCASILWMMTCGTSSSS